MFMMHFDNNQLFCVRDSSTTKIKDNDDDDGVCSIYDSDIIF